MSEILNVNNIRLHQHFADKNEAIAYAGNVLVENGYVTAEYIQSMLEREQDVSVYIGNHLAIPHGMPDSAPYIIKSGITVVQAAGGVRFGDDIAYIVIGIAGKQDTHIEILEKIALVCMEEENVEKMRRATTKEEILAVLGDFS